MESCSLVREDENEVQKQYKLIKINTNTNLFKSVYMNTN